MDPEEVLMESEDKMDKTVDSLQKSLQTIRTGRASPMLVDRIKVDSYGVKTALKGVATISVPEPRVLAIQPWDRSIIGAIEKAILASDLGITPANDGNVIRLNMPDMTEERRRDMVKVAKSRGEESKVGIRNTRRDCNNTLKKLVKDKTVTEDDNKEYQKQIQDATDASIVKIDALVTNKEKDIMEI
ncbi:MAG: ribosome recycling factor [Candidatus Cloacimonadota bacterium]|nr:MAG: ribosome recycling factor [Candidatus Cloacimonadota bacterium]